MTLDGMAPKDSRIRLLADLLLSLPTQLRGAFWNHAALAGAVGTLTMPAAAAAHEVYVLDPATVSLALSVSSPNPFSAYIGNEYQFFLWGFVTAVVLSTIFFASVFRIFESWFAPYMAIQKRWAHFIVRIVAGLCLITYALLGVFFGPELPLVDIFFGGAVALQILFFILGACIIVGLQTRIVALLALLMFAYGAADIGAYALTYIGHAGAYIFLIIRGGGEYTIDHRYHFGWHFRKSLERLTPFAFPLLRIAFGLGIVFSSLYAKLWHSQLALEVIAQYGLTAYFPFDPLFIVLGALIIEFFAGLMLIAGIEVRWTSLFLLFWLTLSHLYFHEPLWVHLSLFGYGIAMLCHGYDRYSLEGRFFKKRGFEPVF